MSETHYCERIIEIWELLIYCKFVVIIVDSNRDVIEVMSSGMAVKTDDLNVVVMS